MFLTGTLLNVAAVLIGTLVGLALGARMPARMQTSLTTGLGLFVVLIGLSMGLRIFTDPAAQPGDDLAVMAAVLIGVAIGELLRLHDGLEWLGPHQPDLRRGARSKRAALESAIATLRRHGYELVTLAEAARRLS